MQIRKLIINVFKNGDQVFHASWFNLSTQFSLFFIFFFIINIASFVERGGKVASAAVVQVVVGIKY